MKRKTSATVIMYTVLVFFFVIWIFPIYTAITKSLQAGGWNSYLSVINNKDVHYFRVVFNSGPGIRRPDSDDDSVHHRLPDQPEVAAVRHHRRRRQELR